MNTSPIAWIIAIAFGILVLLGLAAQLFFHHSLVYERRPVYFAALLTLSVYAHMVFEYFTFSEYWDGRIVDYSGYCVPHIFLTWLVAGAYVVVLQRQYIHAFHVFWNRAKTQTVYDKRNRYFRWRWTVGALAQILFTIVSLAVHFAVAVLIFYVWSPTAAEMTHPDMCFGSQVYGLLIFYLLTSIPSLYIKSLVRDVVDPFGISLEFYWLNVITSIFTPMLLAFLVIQQVLGLFTVRVPVFVVQLIQYPLFLLALVAHPLALQITYFKRTTQPNEEDPWTFETTMSNAERYQLFTQYCTRRWCSQVYLFYEATQQLLLRNRRGEAQLLATDGGRMLRDYLTRGGPLEVSLEPRLMADLRGLLNPEIFKQAVYASCPLPETADVMLAVIQAQDESRAQLRGLFQEWVLSNDFRITLEFKSRSHRPRHRDTSRSSGPGSTMLTETVSVSSPRASNAVPLEEFVVSKKDEEDKKVEKIDDESSSE